MPVALFGIEDGSLNLAVNLLLLVLVVLWLSLVYWTFADARRRIADPVLIGTATIASLIPFIGTIVYTILRPPEFLADAREREIETQASELRMRHLTAQSCPRCEHPIERSWLRCPECRHRLKDPCVSCNRPVDPRWALCPYCETQLRRPEEEPKKRTRRSRSASRPAEGEQEQRQPATRRSQTSGSRSAPPPTDPGARGKRGERPQRTDRPSAEPPAGEGDPSPRRRSTAPS
ncbi:MAG TPA: zinc ribbon domain-containing protein [Solirubrobacterales bacterium]|nr:zinc ribbon domain-containing protein [Solirubrobacterales bacterium]